MLPHWKKLIWGASLRVCSLYDLYSQIPLRISLSRVTDISIPLRAIELPLHEMDVLRENLVGVSFDHKWDILKPCIEELYLNQGKRVNEIMEIMKLEYSFNALLVSS